MTRTERTIVQHWRGIATLCALLFLAGVAVILWHRQDISDRKHAVAYAAATAEANRRGKAVSTLAGDVRALRAQVKAAGKTPAAPDPSKAVAGLNDRTEVPVPIPGPQGAQGTPGAAGADGEDGADSTVPGPQGEQGVQGPVGPAGPAGADGQDGKDGTDGADGKDGQACPTGYSWQAPADDPDALVCRKDDAPAPTPSPTALALVALPPDRRRI
jgi:hypothetical protein